MKDSTEHTVGVLLTIRYNLYERYRESFFSRWPYLPIPRVNFRPGPPSKGLLPPEDCLQA